MKVKGYAWAGLATHDFDRTFRFFTKSDGLSRRGPSSRPRDPDVGPGQQLEIFGGEHPGKALTGSPVIAFEVEDLQASRRDLLAAGVELIGEVGSAAGYQWQYIRSPDGHIFEIKSKPA